MSCTKSTTNTDCGEWRKIWPTMNFKRHGTNASVCRQKQQQTPTQQQRGPLSYLVVVVNDNDALIQSLRSWILKASGGSILGRPKIDVVVHTNHSILSTTRHYDVVVPIVSSTMTERTSFLESVCSTFKHTLVFVCFLNQPVPEETCISSVKSMSSYSCPQLRVHAVWTSPITYEAVLTTLQKCDLCVD